MNLAIRVTCKKQVWQWAHKRCESNGLWEIWAVYYKHLGEKWPCYNKTRMHYTSRSCNVFLSDGTWYRIQHSSNNTDRTLIMFHTEDIHKNIHCEWRAIGAVVISLEQMLERYWYPDSKVHGANMGPTWVLSAPDGAHGVPMNLAIRGEYPVVVAVMWFVLVVIQLAM